jgi:hypothetical protein
MGFYLTAFDEELAVRKLFQNIKNVFPEVNVYFTSDGGLDFSNLISSSNRVKFCMGEDSLSGTFRINGDNYRETLNQKVIVEAALVFLRRMEEAIDYLSSEFIVVIDPDTKFRRKFTVQPATRLLGTRVNSGLPESTTKVLQKYGGIPITAWGANPAIFHAETFRAGLLQIDGKRRDFLEEIAETYYGIFAYDLLIPIVFSLAGIAEKFNANIVECGRNKLWRFSRKPIIHQYRKYYE